MNEYYEEEEDHGGYEDEEEEEDHGGYEDEEEDYEEPHPYNVISVLKRARKAFPVEELYSSSEPPDWESTKAEVKEYLTHFVPDGMVERYFLALRLVVSIEDEIQEVIELSKG